MPTLRAALHATRAHKFGRRPYSVLQSNSLSLEVSSPYPVSGTWFDAWLAVVALDSLWRRYLPTIAGATLISNVQMSCSYFHNREYDVLPFFYIGRS
jgi:integral membrane sensor domain MASE1